MEKSREGTDAFVILFGLVIAYGLVKARWMATENLNEEESVRLASRWILPIVFGLYGLAAETLYRVRWKLDFKLLGIATAALCGVPILVLPPLALLRLGSVAVALSGALLWWLALLPLFFNFIWPSL